MSIFFLQSFLLVVSISISGCKREVVRENAYSANTNYESDQQAIHLADPSVLFDHGTYYLYGTYATDQGFEVYTSHDLKSWKKSNELALKKGDVFGSKKFWAPQVFIYHGIYYMAYTADEHIAIAKSNSPLGPFTQSAKKSFTDPDGWKNIDPFVFIDQDGAIYLYYVRLNNGNRIYVARLENDFSEIQTNTIHLCLDALSAPQSWENLSEQSWTVTEGPSVLKHDTLYYLFYSANSFKSPFYSVGYATAPHPDGPWKKFLGNPILDKQLISENGPGHGDFFRNDDGQYFYVFHTHYSDSQIVPRKAAIIKGAFVNDGSRNDKMRFESNSFYYLKND